MLRVLASQMMAFLLIMMPLMRSMHSGSGTYYILDPVDSEWEVLEGGIVLKALQQANDAVFGFGENMQAIILDHITNENGAEDGIMFFVLETFPKSKYLTRIVIYGYWPHNGKLDQQPWFHRFDPRDKGKSLFFQNYALEGRAEYALPRLFPNKDQYFYAKCFDKWFADRHVTYPPQCILDPQKLTIPMKKDVRNIRPKRKNAKQN